MLIEKRSFFLEKLSDLSKRVSSFLNYSVKKLKLQRENNFIEPEEKNHQFLLSINEGINPRKIITQQQSREKEKTKKFPIPKTIELNSDNNENLFQKYERSKTI